MSSRKARWVVEVTTLGSLVLLALLDSTSFGTLLVPIWLLMTPGRMRVGRVLLFLLTVTAMYFGIGVALLYGASALFDAFHGVQTTDAFLIGQFVVGAVLVFALTYECRRRSPMRACAP